MLMIKRYTLFFLSLLIFFALIPLDLAAKKPSHAGRQSASVRVYDPDLCDRQPSFPGGYNAMVSFINQTRHYPENAYRNRVEGRVLCSFMIEPDGRLTDVRVICSVEESLDREAVRIISSMPRWEAALVGDRPVKVHYILPIHFRR